MTLKLGNVSIIHELLLKLHFIYINFCYNQYTGERERKREREREREREKYMIFFITILASAKKTYLTNVKYV